MGIQDPQQNTSNSLTWAGCIHYQEGGWPRGVCPIALRAGRVYYLPAGGIHVIICGRGGSRSRGPHLMQLNLEMKVDDVGR
jgi:hypothetical protein